MTKTPSSRVAYARAGAEHNGHIRIMQPWRPFGIRNVFFFVLSLLSLALLCVVTYLFVSSEKQNGLYHIGAEQSIPDGIFFAYKYLPVIVIILYSLLWAVLDADARRYEPYPDLSRPEGTSGDSLFYEYSYEYALLVPFKAIRRRHWGVCLASSAFLLSAIILDSFAASLLGVENVADVKTVDLNNVPVPTVPLAQQEAVLNGEYLTLASSILLDGADTPPFTFGRYSIAPFTIRSDEDISATSTITADSNVYWSELACRPVQGNITIKQLTHEDDIIRKNVTELYLMWSDVQYPGRSCGKLSVTNEGIGTIELGSLDKQQDSLQPFASWFDATSLMTYHGPQDTTNSTTCLPSRWHTSTIVTATPLRNATQFSENTQFTDKRFNTGIQSFVCEASYFTARSSATVYNANRSVITVDEAQIQQSKSPMKTDIMNLDLFESQLGGIALCRSVDERRPDATFSNSFRISSGTSVGDIAFKMAGNVSALLERGAEGFPPLLDKAFGTAFAVAHHSVSSEDRLGTTPSTLVSRGTLSRSLIAVKVNRVSGIIMLSVLGVLFLVPLVLSRIYSHRKSVLKSDPDSLSATLSLIADSDDVGQRRFGALSEATQRHTTRDLKQLVTASRYRLRPGNSADGEPLCIFEACSGNAVTEGKQEDTPKQSQHALGSDPLPLMFTNLGAITIITTFVGLGIGLGILYQRGKDGGYAFRADSDFWSQVLWTFCFALVASLIGLNWDNIYRDVCVLEPFARLIQGNARPGQSISLKYASRPPVVNVLPALSRRHVLVTLAAIVALSTSVFKISMASLFALDLTGKGTVTIQTTQFATSMNGPFWAPRFYRLNGAANLVRTNMSDGSRLPPWTTPEYAIVPLNIQPQDSDKSATYSAKTLAFRAGLTCQALENQNLDLSGRLGDVLIRGFFNTTNVDSSPISCLMTGDYPLNNGTRTPETQGVRVLPTVDGFSNTPGDCAKNAVIVVESGGQLSLNKPVGDIYNFTVVGCRPWIRAMEVNVEFESDGNVLHSEEIPNTDRTEPAFKQGWKSLLGAFTESFTDTAKRSMFDYEESICGDPRFDWMGLLIARHRDTWFADPASRNLSSLMNASSDVFGMIFASFVAQHREQLFDESGSSTRLPTLKHFLAPRQRPSLVMFIIAITFIVLYLISFIIIFIRRRTSSPPRLPKSLGVIIAYCFASGMLQDFQHTYGMSTKQRDRHTHGQGKLYGFGWFTGTDGELHEGIEREPLMRR